MAKLQNAHHNVADLLNAAKTGPLAIQEGKTADALVQLFDEGEQIARDIARKNGVKKDSYTAALNSVHNLRQNLSNIADRYNQEINKILQSNEPAAVKVPQVLAAIGRGQQEANLAAANCGGDIGDAGQQILDQETAGQSFRQFAKANGIDMSQLFRSRDTKGLEPTVQGMLGSQGASVAGTGAGGTLQGVNPTPGGGAVGTEGMVPVDNPGFSGQAGTGGAGPLSGVNAGSGGTSGSGLVSAANPGPNVPAVTAGGPGTGRVMATSFGTAANPPAAPPPIAPQGPNPTSPAPAAPGSAPLSPVASPLPDRGPGPAPLSPVANPAPLSPVANPAPLSPVANPAPLSPVANPAPPTTVAPGTISAPSPFAPSPMFNPANVGMTPGPASGALNAAAFQGGIAPPNLMPADFPHHLEAGLMPPGAGGIPPTPPIAPQVAPTPVSPATAPTAGSGDWHSAIPAEQPSTPQASSPSYSSQAASPSTSMSSPTNPGYMSSTTAPSTSYTGGPLPTYGSDLRPPTPSAPAGSPSPPPSAAPNLPPATGSPSTNPAAGSGGSVAQTGVVRSDSATASSQQPAPMGLAGKAVGASAVGAMAGAASADATARIRLQRIVDAVARQESRLAWAAGDRPDDTTVLITDLAHGWIPPGVEIPSVVTLLEPGRRRGDLEALLGEVKTAVMHTPDRYVPEEDESVPTSPRPRHAPEIEELGWELSSATHWRDGLPRLAHTLAKAASSGTGVDPSEVELLQQQMHDVGELVLDAYPDEIDPKHVGNWQLLAAIEALIRADRVGANYHLAWFQACMTSTTGPQL